MKLLSRALLCSVFLCCFVPGAYAQATAPGQPWTFGLGIAGSYEGNALFVGSDSNVEFAHQLQAALGRNWTLRRGAVRLSADANQSFYRESTSLNDFRYTVGGGVTHELTRRLSWAGTSIVTSGLARDAEVLTDAGLVLPSSVTARTSNSSSTFAYVLSRRSNISWSLSQQGVGFSSAVFSGGSLVTSNLSWTRQVARSQTLGITQDYTRTFTSDTIANDSSQHSILGLLGTWIGPAVRGWTPSANAGVRPYSVPGEGGYRFALGMSAGLTKLVRPGQVFGVTYDRTISQTFGVDLSNRLLQNVSVSYGLALRRNVTTSFGGNYSVSDNPVTPEQRITGQIGQATLTYLVTPKLGVMVGGSIYSRTLPAVARATSYRMMTSLTYGTSWR